MFNVKFGKLAAKFDSRNLQLSLLLKPAVELLPVPDSFNIDQSLNASFVPNAYGNRTWGDCVIASRANQTLRLEYSEQKKAIPITADDCLREYWREQRGWMGGCRHPDGGLVLLDSLKKWRKNGWQAARECYSIHAFAAINLKKPLEIKQGIYLLGGVQLGVQVPQSALDQTGRNEPWTVTDANSPIRGGHCIYLIAYDSFGVTCMTWGTLVKIGWYWLGTYADEAFCVIDNPDRPGSPVDVEKLEGFLEAVTG